MTQNNVAAIKYYEDHYDQFLEQLNRLISIPSVSTDPKKADDILKTAQFLEDYLKLLGFEETQVIKTERHPLLFGVRKSPNPEAKTLLIYGHYDVQPTDPLNEWASDPFKATQKDDYLYARGSSDMKGQIMACLFAIESSGKDQHDSTEYQSAI